MSDNSYTPSRRSLIGSIGAASLGSVLTGCVDSEDETVAIEASVDIIDTDEQRVLQVDLSVTPIADVKRVYVLVNHSEAAVVEDVAESMELTVPIDGGRHYSAQFVAQRGTDPTDTVRKKLDLGFIPQSDAPLHGERTLCAHYYPWYDADDEEWTESSPSTPLRGEYDSRNESTIERHLEWCEQAGIDWLSASWWGPDSYTDTTLRDHVFNVDRAREFEWSILYETAGRFDNLPVDIDEEQAKNTLLTDLQYLSEHYFGEPWYHMIDDRPVLYIYLGFQYDGDVVGAWEEAVAQIDTEPYLIVDVGNSAVPSVLPFVEPADAITTYNPYEAREDIADVFREETKSMYRSWFLGRDVTDVDIMPTAIPGFDDSRIRDNPVLEPSHELYDWGIRTARQYATGNNTVFITSFNEWYEDTQIEPSESREETFLHVTDDIFAQDEYEYPNFDGKTLSLEFSETVAEEAITSDIDSNRQLSFYCETIRVKSPQGEILDTYDIGSDSEPLVLSGAYASQNVEGTTGRWFGGGSITSIYVNDITPRYTIELVGRASSEMDVVAYHNSREIGSASVGEINSTYQLD